MSAPAYTPELSDLAHAIARHLGGPWRVDLVESWRFILRGPSGAGVFGSTTWKTGRLALHGCQPDQPGAGTRIYLGGKHEITVSRDAPPDRVASELKRRLLPAYLVDFASALQRVREADDEERASVALARELGKPYTHSPREGTMETEGWCRFRVSSPDRVRFEMDVDAMTARAIAELLKDGKKS